MSTLIEQLTHHYSSNIAQLNLTSSSQKKITCISNLDRFQTLITLNLSNNLISRIENLHNLNKLRVLNLQFNQIVRLQGIQKLPQLQELFLSYNCIEYITDTLALKNQQLHTLHLAYNDLKTLDSMHIVLRLKNLVLLSVYGNPFLQTLNYVSFLKTLMPNLLILDDRQMSESFQILSNYVHPYQEIQILKSALDQLMEERDKVIEQLQYKNISQIEEIKINREKNKQVQGQSIQRQSRVNKYIGIGIEKQQFNMNKKVKIQKQQLLEIIKHWLVKNQDKLSVCRRQIASLTDFYNNKIKMTEKHEQEMFCYQQCINISTKLQKYQELEFQGKLSMKQIHKKQQLEKKLRMKQNKLPQMTQNSVKNKKMSNITSKNILEAIKEKEQKSNELKQLQVQLNKLELIVNNNSQFDIHRIILFRVLFGNTVQQDENMNYRLLKKFLIQKYPLISTIRAMKIAIFGEQVDDSKIMQLTAFLNGKCLVQLLNHTKSKQKEKNKKLQLDRKKIVNKLQKQTEQICYEWQALKKAKQEFEVEMNKSRKQHLLVLQERVHNMQDQYQEIQNQQKEKIIQLKRKLQLDQDKVKELKREEQQINLKLQRKYRQLEEFQAYFEDFKRSKQDLQQMNKELEEVGQDLNLKKQIKSELEQSITQKELTEVIFSNKLKQLEKRTIEKTQQFKDIGQKYNKLMQKYHSFQQQERMRKYQLTKLEEQMGIRLEEDKEMIKNIQRAKNSLQIYTEKIRNLQQMESSKKVSLRNLEVQVQEAKKLYYSLSQRNNEIEHKLVHQTEELYQYQLKMNQNKHAIESLTDINKSITDMMDRQSQLKRNVMGLEIQIKEMEEARDQLKATNNSNKLNKII